MLVLTRPVGGTIDIGPQIRITVIALDHSNVRLGITAPEQLLPSATETHERAQSQTPEQLAKNHIIWR
jgi:carbon storage regulator CsrA